MKIATWNVNGFRAREQQLFEWIGREQPDVLCLQEIKVQSSQLSLFDIGPLSGYENYFHGGGGYSGVSIHVKKGLGLGPVTFHHPAFDFETRFVEARAGNYSFVSVYVPNGGKDYPAKLAFFEAMVAWAKGVLAEERELALLGDLNIAHRPMDVHPSNQDPRVVGQRSEERLLFDGLLAAGLTDVVRAKFPQENHLFTWWPYWRQAREKNVGWRIDYMLASARIAERVSACVSQREFGASDHAPLVIELEYLP